MTAAVTNLDPDGLACYSDHAHDVTTVGQCMICGSAEKDVVGHVMPDVPRVTGLNPVEAARRVVETQTGTIVDGVLLDYFTAQHIVQVHDALNEANQAKLARMTLPVAASVCFKLANR